MQSPGCAVPPTLEADPPSVPFLQRISSDETGFHGAAVNWVHVHLILCHAPVLGCIIGLFLLIFALIRSSRDLLIGALWILLLSAIVGIPTYTSGGRSEDAVE